MSTAPIPASARSKFEHVPLPNALLYGTSAIPLSMVGTCLALYLMIFYTKSLGVNPLAVSAVLFIGSLWDAVSDQIMGQWSDRTTWKLGRRRPYFLLGAPLFAISFYYIMTPPQEFTDMGVFWYLLFWRLVLFTSATMIYVPLYALVPEMAQTYHGRTRLTAYREAFGNVGDLVGMVAVPIVTLAVFSELDSPDRPAYSVVGWIGAGATVIFVAAAYFGSYEDPEAHAAPTVDWRAGFIAMRDNTAFRQLIFATAFPGMAIQMIAGLFLFVIEDVLRVEDPFYTIQAFGAYVAVAILSYPVWSFLARKIGKANIFRASMLLLAVGYLGVYVLHEGTLWRLFPIMAAAGAGSAGFWTGMFSQLADIADMDELETGSRREGLFAGFAALMRKIGYAVGGGAIGVGLTAVGYQKGVEVQSDEVIFGLKLLFSIPTCALVLMGMWIFRKYPVTEESHADVLKQLEARRNGPKEAPVPS